MDTAELAPFGKLGFESVDYILQAKNTKSAKTCSLLVSGRLLRILRDCPPEVFSRGLGVV